MSNEIKAYEFFCKYPGHTKTATIEIAERLGISYDDVSKGRKHFNSGIRPSKDTNEVSSKKDHKEEAKIYNSVDDYQQFLEDYNIKEEDVVQVYYKQKAHGIQFTVQTRKGAEKELDEEKLYKYLKGYEYKGSAPNEYYNPKDGVAVLNIFDAHIDKLGYVGSGGLQEMNSNIDTLLEGFKTLFTDIIAHHSPHTVIFPVGNDFFNTNGSFPETRAGTPQKITVGWQDSFQAGVEFYRQCIDMMTEYVDVHIVNIPGNHDHDKVFYLGEILKAVYERNSRVTMNLGKDPRKYVYTKDVLFGFAHGKEEKRKIKELPTVMYIERPKLCADVKHKIWLLGDIHHKEEYSFLHSLEHNGVEVKFLRSACSTDEWHHESLWIGAKKSISYIVYKDDGNRMATDELFI